MGLACSSAGLAPSTLPHSKAGGAAARRHARSCAGRTGTGTGTGASLIPRLQLLHGLRLVHLACSEQAPAVTSQQTEDTSMGPVNAAGAQRQQQRVWQLSGLARVQVGRGRRAAAPDTTPPPCLLMGSRLGLWSPMPPSAAAPSNGCGRLACSAPAAPSAAAPAHAAPGPARARARRRCSRTAQAGPCSADREQLLCGHATRGQRTPCGVCRLRVRHAGCACLAAPCPRLWHPVCLPARMLRPPQCRPPRPCWPSAAHRPGISHTCSSCTRWWEQA